MVAYSRKRLKMSLEWRSGQQMSDEELENLYQTSLIECHNCRARFLAVSTADLEGLCPKCTAYKYLVGQVRTPKKDRQWIAKGVLLLLITALATLYWWMAGR
jgi:Zn finger protein HypA/HybF involved in hydrogenase expression